MSALALGGAGNILNKIQADQAISLMPLTARVARELRLNIQDSRALVNEYTLFLDLKVFFEDWDAEMLSPSAKIDAVWHLHVLDTGSYGAECHKLCGRMIHHNPDGAEDIDRKERYERTLNAYKDVFQKEPPADIWLEQAVQPTLSQIAERAPQAVQAPHAPNVVQEGVPQYTLHIQEVTGKRTQFSFDDASITVGVLKARIEDRRKIPINEIRLIFAEVLLKDNNRLSDCNIESGSTIHLSRKLSGC